MCNSTHVSTSIHAEMYIFDQVLLHFDHVLEIYQLPSIIYEHDPKKVSLDHVHLVKRKKPTIILYLRGS